MNTVVKENGKEVNLEERGINTDIEKAQVVTKDDVVDKIDTKLHTDLLNSGKVKELINDLNQIYSNVGEIREQIVITRALNESDDEYTKKIVDGLAENKIIVISRTGRADGAYDSKLINTCSGSNCILYDSVTQIYAQDLSENTIKYDKIENTELFMKNGKQYGGVNGKIFYDLQSVVMDASQEIVKMSIDDNLEYGWQTYAIETKDKNGKKVTVYGYTPFVQSSEASAAIGLNKINEEIKNGNYIPLGAVIVSINHSHGKEYTGSNWSEFFSDGDMGNKSISVETPTGKVYQYNQDSKSILYYGTVDITQSINQNHFEIKIEKFNGLKLKYDNSGNPMLDANGDAVFDVIQHEKTIVYPINKSGGEK